MQKKKRVTIIGARVGSRKTMHAIRNAENVGQQWAIFFSSPHYSLHEKTQLFHRLNERNRHELLNALRADSKRT